MKTYDESTKKEIQNPDLTKGYVYEGTIVVGKTEPEEVIMNGSVTPSRPNGLREYKPAKDIVEVCQYYHAYTEEELAQKESEKSVDKKISDAVTAAVMLSQGGVA